MKGLSKGFESLRDHKLFHTLESFHSFSSEMIHTLKWSILLNLKLSYFGSDHLKFTVLRTHDEVRGRYIFNYLWWNPWDDKDSHYPVQIFSFKWQTTVCCQRKPSHRNRRSIRVGSGQPSFSATLYLSFVGYVTHSLSIP